MLRAKWPMRAISRAQPSSVRLPTRVVPRVRSQSQPALASAFDDEETFDELRVLFAEAADREGFTDVGFTDGTAFRFPADWLHQRFPPSVVGDADLTKAKAEVVDELRAIGFQAGAALPPLDAASLDEPTKEPALWTASWWLAPDREAEQ